jgi:hypothetical protein
LPQENRLSNFFAGFRAALPPRVRKFALHFWLVLAV